MYYFGHSQKQKDISFEFVQSQYSKLMSKEVLESYLPVRNDSGSYIFNYWEENKLRFTGTYVCPRLSPNLEFPFCKIFPEDYQGADTDIGEIINLASDLRPYKFFDVVNDFLISCVGEHLNFKATSIFITVNPRHVNFYERLGFVTLNLPKFAHDLNLPAQLMVYTVGEPNETI